MTWAEFQIRSFGLKRVQKWQMQLTREIAYEVHTTKYIWGKKKPPKKDVFWPIEEKKKMISDAALEAFKRARQEYKEQINGTVRSTT